MPLETSWKKRDFDVTREPRGSVRKRRSGEPIFVVQEHHATRLHFDLRLEIEGVLASWAVTKEPTLDPSIRRLAVKTEDHPIGYATFEGSIPKGEYGAGEMTIWDQGTWEPADGVDPAEAVEQGKISFLLHGERLRGEFALVRTGDAGERNWLLIKKRDDEARPAADGSAKRERPTKSTAAKTKPSVTKAGAPPEEIERSSEEKMMFPEAGVTKGDLLDYYDRIADLLLPWLEGRPMTLERLPDGLRPRAPHFWQKNTPDYYPHWIPRVSIASESGEMVDYVLVNDRQTLLYLVNQGTVTFHPWLSRVGSLDTPDMVYFDLDPGEKGFAQAMRVARRLHPILEDAGVASTVKTSGKRGLHVIVPWEAKQGGYEEARAWAMEIAERLVAEMPEEATVERSKAKRGDRLYVDVMQNARGHHIIPPYVVRPTPAASVSTPLRWDELRSGLTGDRYTVKNIFRRLAQWKRS